MCDLYGIVHDTKIVKIPILERDFKDRLQGYLQYLSMNKGIRIKPFQNVYWVMSHPKSQVSFPRITRPWHCSWATLPGVEWSIIAWLRGLWSASLENGVCAFLIDELDFNENHQLSSFSEECFRIRNIHMYDSEGNSLKFNFLGYEKTKWPTTGRSRKKEDHLSLQPFSKVEHDFISVSRNNIT